MEFNNRLYELRKRKGLSQEELAGKLEVSRQTVSKWENGESTSDMEKLVAMSDLFDMSLDELVLGKEQADKLLTPENKKKVGKIVRIIGIAAAVIFVIDLISMMVSFLLFGIPSSRPFQR